MSKKKLRKEVRRLKKKIDWLWSIMPAHIVQAEYNRIHNERMELLAHDILNNSFKNGDASD